MSNEPFKITIANAEIRHAKIFNPKRIHTFNHCHVDVCKIQCISPISDGSYDITLVSGWELKRIDDRYTQRSIIEQHWRALLPNRIYNACEWLIDLHRVQCIGPFDSEEYAVTLVSGWELKLLNSQHKFIDIYSAWEALTV